MFGSSVGSIVCLSVCLFGETGSRVSSASLNAMWKALHEVGALESLKALQLAYENG